MCGACGWRLGTVPTTPVAALQEGDQGVLYVLSTEIKRPCRSRCRSRTTGRPYTSAP